MENESVYSTVRSQISSLQDTVRCEPSFRLFKNFLFTHKLVKRHEGDCLQVEEFDEVIFEESKEFTVKNNFKPMVEIDNNEEKYSVTCENNLEIENGMKIENLKFEVSRRVEESKESEKKYKISSNEKSIIQLPKNIFCTDDYDIKYLVDLINEDTSQGWIKVFDEKSIKTYKKKVPESEFNIVRTIAEIEGFTKEQIFDALSYFEVRKQWDKVMQDFSIIETNQEDESEIVYSSVKPPVFFISKRDFIQKRKIRRGFPTSDSILCHVKSHKHPNFPEKSSPVRGEIILGGLYLQTISENPLKVLYCTIGQNDMKGNISPSMINDMFPKGAKDMLKTLTVGLNKIYKGKK